MFVSRADVLLRVPRYRPVLRVCLPTRSDKSPLAVHSSSPFSTTTPQPIFATVPRQSFFTEHPTYTTLLIASLSLLAGGTIAYNLSPIQVLSLIRRGVPEPGSPEEKAYKEKIEKQLMDFPLARKLRADPEFQERRMWENAPEAYRAQSLLSGTLSGPGMIAVPGLVFVNEKEKTVVSLIHVGHRVSGFPTIVHGGLIGALLDEALARAAILPLKQKSVVTANLNINYRAPAKTDQILVIKTVATEATERKSLVAGTVSDASGKLLAESTGVFVVPKKYKVSDLTAM